jgi:C4-dicarboxylate-specific signal transduction histidine kinase
MGNAARSAGLERWELAAESIAIRIRWFGVFVGYVLANVGPARDRPILNAILALGAVYTALDTYYTFRGRVFLGRYPLTISLMEALFIGLLCFFHQGLESPFRYYYFLSLICGAIRHSSRVTYATCALHSASYTLLYFIAPAEKEAGLVLVLTLVMLGWVAWASNSMALLLKRVGEHLERLNEALRENQAQLEARIIERTRQLQEAQAHLLHQEKMAAFGLLAAGIAHEVGNPLTSISSLVQMLQRRDCDDYAREKLALVNGQLSRIQNILRELINFSRPTSTERTRVPVHEVVDEALNIAKYYKGSNRRTIEAKVPHDLPALEGVRDHFVQAILNLVLNAVDATTKEGRIELAATERDGQVTIAVRDDGHGIAPQDAAKLFQPYFTTKKHGTGLGLFVTRKLLADQGGTVDFVSVPEGGAEFRIRLPIADCGLRIADSRDCHSPAKEHAAHE